MRSLKRQYYFAQMKRFWSKICHREIGNCARGKTLPCQWPPAVYIKVEQKIDTEIFRFSLSIKAHKTS